MTIQRSKNYIVFIIHHTLVLGKVSDQQLHPLPLLDLSCTSGPTNMTLFGVIRLRNDYGWEFFILAVDR